MCRLLCEDKREMPLFSAVVVRPARTHPRAESSELQTHHACLGVGWVRQNGNGRARTDPHRPLDKADLLSFGEPLVADRFYKLARPKVCHAETCCPVTGSFCPILLASSYMGNLGSRTLRPDPTAGRLLRWPFPPFLPPVAAGEYIRHVSSSLVYIPST